MTNDVLAMAQAIKNAKLVPTSVDLKDLINGGMPQDLLQELNKLGWVVIEAWKVKENEVDH